MKQKIPVVIVDDNVALLEQLQENLNGTDSIEIMFTACNGKDLIKKLSTAPRLPEIILMDIEMPEMNGIEATKLVTGSTKIKVLILTVFDNDDKVFDAIKAGAAGYLLKDSKAFQIVNAIEDVMMGGGPMSPLIASKALSLLRGKLEVDKTPQPKDYHLSEREIELLQLLVEGLSYQQIANRLFISHGTVRKHIENIYGKLHINSKVEAVQKAHKNKWFS